VSQLHEITASDKIFKQREDDNTPAVELKTDDSNDWNGNNFYNDNELNGIDDKQNDVQKVDVDVDLLLSDVDDDEIP
jgi:hypothetical protein